MLGQEDLIAFVATRDAARASEFYVGVLGLTLVSDDSFALVLDAKGVTVRVQKVEQFQPQPFTALGWQVSDIEQVVARLWDLGVRLERFPGLNQDARGVWSSPSGARVAWFKDPDGNVLSLTEP